MYEWSLDVLYKGYESEEFQRDFASVAPLIDELNQLANKLDLNHPKESLLAVLTLIERFYLLSENLKIYISLRQSCDTTNSTTVAYANQLSKKCSEATVALTQFNKFIAKLNLDELVDKDEMIKTYEYFLRNVQKDAKHLLSDDVESIISKLNLSGGKAWSNLQEYLTSTVEVDFNEQKLGLSAIRNLAYHADSKVRKAAYEAELAAYEKIKDPVSFSLNNIKQQVTTLSNLRGYESVLAMTLEDSHMQKATLDAMMKAIESHLPKFWEYLRAKGRKLGYADGLPWYEMFATLGNSSTKFTPETSKTFLVQHFSSFAPDLAKMVETAFDDQWIDFYPRKGKVGGAFCYGLLPQKQSRILTNFDGSLGDVVTLAHELGHAYHGLNIQSHRPLNAGYSMPVAETASTFNENLIMNCLISETADADEKMGLIDNQLQDLNQIISDIYSRFLFESAIFENVKDGFTFADQCCEIMLESQKKAYGTGLDQSTLNPYMWVCKSHYYSEDLSFYNFPYAFGGLFARGLYAKYKAEGQSFVPKYKAMLKATTVMDVEEVASICGIDLTDVSFWDEALNECDRQIDQFIELVK